MSDQPQTGQPQSDRAKPDEKAASLLRSTASVGLMTTLSRITGAVRDTFLATQFGMSGGVTDAFFVAFRIPNFLRRLFSEGAFSQAFVPVLTEYRERRTVTEVLALVNAVTGVLASILLLVTVLSMWASPAITAVFAPGYYSKPELFDLTARMVRITFPYLLLISLTGLAGSILNAYGRFRVPAFSPVFMNLCMMLGAWVGVRYSPEPVVVLAWSVTLSGVVQLLFHVPFLVKIGRLPRRPWPDFRHEGVRRILKLMLPSMFGVSVSQVNMLLNTMLASFLPLGSITWIYFSDRLTELPIGVFGVALGTVVLPTLSRNHANASVEVFRDTLAWGVRTVLVIALPATAALVVLAEPLLCSLFQYHATTPRDVHMAAWSLRACSLGLSAFMLIKVLAPGFYARQDTSTPVGIGMKALVANMVLNLLLVYPLHHFWQLGHMGLSISQALAACLNAGLLWWVLRREGIWHWGAKYRGSVSRMLVITGLMCIFLVLVTPPMETWFAWRWWQRLPVLLAICSGAAMVYFGGLRLLGFRFRDFRHHA